MDASTVAEIAKQLGIATDKVGTTLESLLPQYVTYMALGYVRSFFMEAFALVIFIVSAYLLLVFADSVINDAPYLTIKYRRYFVAAGIIAIVFALLCNAMSFARVATAPEMSLIRFILNQ